MTGYPALVDDGDGVALALLDTRGRGRGGDAPGVVRLIGFELGDALARTVRSAPAWTSIGLPLRGAMPPDRLQDDVRDAIADRAFIGDDPLPRDRDAFAEQVKRARTRLPAVTDSALRAAGGDRRRLPGAVAAHRGDAGRASGWSRPRSRQQRDALVHPGFVAATPWEQLGHIPRYLQALARRIERRAQNPERDARHAKQVAEWWARYQRAAEAARRSGPVSPGARRVSLAAGGAAGVAVRAGAAHAGPVSFKRIEKAWAEIAEARLKRRESGIQSAPVLESVRPKNKLNH